MSVRVGALLALVSIAVGGAARAAAPPRAPFVDVERAAALLAAGALAVDARAARDYQAGHLPGAVHLEWTDFRDGPAGGRLPDDDAALARRLGARGIDGERPVVVYGAAAAGWGEEGRVAWMLAYLGHPAVHILDGGVAAWRAAGRPLARGDVAPAPGRFTPRRDPALRARLDEVIAATRDGRTVVVDTRTPAEWGGAHPYGEPRGGHIPGAVLLPWSALLDGDGRLRAPAGLEQVVAGAGLRRDRPTIVYCTGGVRSAFVWAALRALGFTDVRNFDGSFHAWASRPDLPVVTGDGPR